jgi:hypothetical protein
MAKKKARSQTANLTFNHQKLGIALISLCVKHWKALDEGYTFVSNLISIKSLHAKLWALKVAKVPTMGISRLSLVNAKDKCHLDASHVASHKIYYKGEGDGFPQVRAMVSLMNLSLPMVHPSPKSA